ncbi:MAG: ATP-binding protein [Bacteroidales bacterium]|nr:ATP-binding protein [Bacteroidales bacterium]
METKRKNIDTSDRAPKAEPSDNPAESAAAVSFLITIVFLMVMVPAILIIYEGELTELITPGSVGMVAGTAVLFFFAVRYLIGRFIQSRLEAVYRIMHTATDSQRKGNMASVEREVMEWARSKESEIKSLKASELWRKEFIGNVSHELKTPIFNLQGLILTLLDGGLEDKSINRMYLQRSEKSINRLISIVEDLQTISRLESEAKTLQLGKFSLRKLVAEVIEAQEVRAEAKKVTLSTDGGKEPFVVEADRTRIFQVFANLLVNSINYGHTGGSTVVSMTPFGDKVLVEVSDDGVGIEEEHLPRIFERFYRVEKHRSRDSGGTGLGLAIVKHIIEAHGHTVMVKSKPGGGSTFSFTLTLA